MQQQITRGDYLEDLITIYIENNLQQGLDDLYDMFVFQCGEIQKQLTPAPVIKISFTEAESKLLTNYNTCYLAGITKDGHKETFNGSISFNTRGEVVYYEPTPNSSLQASTTSTIACPCTGISGVFANCTQPAIKAYFSINYVPTKLSELQNDTDFQDSVDVAESISIHNASTEAHPYIQSLIADNTQAIEYEASVRATETEALEVMINNETSVRAGQTEALSISIGAETTAREEAVSLAIQTTKAYADTIVAGATTAINTTIGDLDNLDTSVKSSVVNAINSEVSDRQSADNNLQGQIDALAAASDVTDIVGTYAELQAYDTQHLNDNDIIKVLSDSTHDDEPSYYRFDKDTDTFSYIGSESAAYTKAQSNSMFVTQTTTINGKALSSDISLTYSDINALPATTQNVIDAHTSAIAANTSAIAANTTAIAANTSAISTINGKIPTDASTTNKLVSASTLAASIADFANQDLSNLTSDGEARLHALKSYADNGELLTDADGLAFVNKYAHSTFDLSKFTVVGSPNITDDGIASGFGASNYLQTANISMPTNPKIYIKFNLSNLTDMLTPLLQLSSFNRIIVSTDGTVTVFASEDNVTSTGISISNIFENNPIQINTNYLLVVSTDGVSQWNFKLTNLDTNTTVSENRTLARHFYTTSSNWYIGSDGSRYVRGQVDLKQFSITVDGVEVFSGNKTGIDTIKPDDYTVVGTPTISADGIASGFSASNYLTAILNNNGGNLLEFECRFNIASDIDSTTMQDIVRSSGFVCGYQNFDGKAIRIRWGSNDNSWDFLKYTGFAVNTWYVFKGTFNKTSGLSSLYLYDDSENLLTSGTRTLTGMTFLTTDFSAYIGTEGSSRYFTGSIDLNVLKLNLDGKVIYQPCLKIPYTQSKTGSKIVDSIYRDRVNDMATQFGYANYYTLQDESKGNYTVVGSPTISSDFVASGFSASNYITKNINFSTVPTINSLTVEGKFVYQYTSDGIGTIFGFSSNTTYNNSPRLHIDGTGSMYFYMSDGSHTQDNAIERSIYNLQNGDIINFKTIYSNASVNITFSINGGENINVVNSNSSGMSFNFNYLTAVLIGHFGGSSSYSRGSIDLKSFKIYVDNKLAYEAVTDPNFTLPQVELYGLIARQNFAPSNKYDNLTLGASGSTYTAPSDGWFTLNKVAGAVGYAIVLSNSTTGLVVSQYAVSATDYLRIYIPAKKNDVITATYLASGTTNYFRFIYSVGSESEA